MSYLLKNGNTTRPLVFLLVQTSDHITGLTGATPTVTISKNGAAFASPAGAVTEIGNGWYKVAANATDAGTNGPLLLHATAASGDPCDVTFEVVNFDPEDAAALGLTRLDAAVTSRMATYTQPTGFLAATFPSGTVANTTNITAGTITTVTNLTNAPTAGDLTATMKTSVENAIWDGLTASHATAGSFGVLIKTDLDAAVSSRMASFTLPTNFSALGIGVTGHITTVDTTTSVTNGVTVTTNNDKTGYALSAAGVQAIWDALTSALTTVGSIGKKLADWVLGTDHKAMISTDAQTGVVLPRVTLTDTLTTYTGNTPQTGDAFARLGAPTGASVSVDIAAVKTSVGSPMQAGSTVALSAAGLDNVVIEVGLNARQALAISASAVAGVLAGAATTSITIAGAGVPSTNRITATVDANGNRSAVTLAPPA